MSVASTRYLKLFASATSALLVLAVANPLHAEDPREEDARCAFEAGRTRVSEERYEEACALFERSLKLVDGIGTMYNLADCYEKLGRRASAFAMFHRAADAARAVQQEARERAARDRALALEASLSRLLVRLDPAEGPVEVKKNGEHLDTGKAIPVDPGAYRISVLAPGKKPWFTEVDVPELGVVQVHVPHLEDAKVRAPPSIAPSRQAMQPSTPFDDPARDGSFNSAKRVALILGGVGAASLVAGAVFGIQYKLSNHDARATCPSSMGCARSQIERHAEFVASAKSSRAWSFVGIGLGTAALAGAGVVYWTSARRPRAELGASASANLDGSWTASINGLF